MKIVFTGGGTGGHVFPIIAVAREILNLEPLGEIKFFYIGPKDYFAPKVLQQEGIKPKFILAGKVRRYLDPVAIILNIIDFFKLIIGFFQAFFHLFILAPDLIFSRGGYGAFPVSLAAKILSIPLFLHESDISPGLANKISSRFSLEIFVSFPNTEYFDPHKLLVVGNPIREGVLYGSPERAKLKFKITNEKPLVLILGGSQGAQRINETIVFILNELLRDFEVFHQCGKRNFKKVKQEAKIMIPSGLEKYYHLQPFLNEEDLGDVYQLADLVVARAGSATIFELAALGKPSILIPLPEAAQNHQTKNAYVYAKTGAAMVIEEANLTPHFLLERLKFLIARPEEMEKMSLAAQRFARPKAAKVIAHYLVEYLKQ